MRSWPVCLCLLLVLRPEVGVAQTTAAPASCPPTAAVADVPDPREPARGNHRADALRFITFVIDSQFVMANVPLDSATGRFTDPHALGDLKCADLAWLSELPEPEARRWSACRGVPVMLVLTKSKQWRPPAKPNP